MMVPLHLHNEAPQYEAPVISPIADDVIAGLMLPPGKRKLPPRLFYDERGSELFEQITQLPEYYLTRTERAIFERHAADMLRAAGAGLTLIELGAGTAAKTHVILRALLRQQLTATF